MVTSQELLLMSPEEYKAHTQRVVQERKEKVRELKTQIREKKVSKKKRKKFKSFAKTYRALESAIKGKKKKIKKVKVSKRVKELRRRIAELEGRKIRQGVERRKVNILARIEDKIPRTFFKGKEEDEEEHQMSFLGK